MKLTVESSEWFPVWVLHEVQPDATPLFSMEVDAAKVAEWEDAFENFRRVQREIRLTAVKQGAISSHWGGD